MMAKQQDTGLKARYEQVLKLSMSRKREIDKLRAENAVLRGALGEARELADRHLRR